MAFVKMHYREDYWFVGGLLLASLFGVIAGSSLSIPFLAACSLVLLFAWFASLGYCVVGQPGPGAVWLAFAVPIMLIATWLTVVVSVWGFFR